MSSSVASKEQAETATKISTTTDYANPPQYYNSKPSNQPPQYPHASGVNVACPSISASGASAANISAILAYPSASQLQDEQEKRSWRERWREWKARNTDAELSRVQVSGPTLNVQGVGVKSWTSITPASKRPGK